jgi:hypothetical protein
MKQEDQQEYTYLDKSIIPIINNFIKKKISKERKIKNKEFVIIDCIDE